MSKEIEDHRILNRSGNEPFSSVLERHISRRGVMHGGMGMAAMTMMSGFGLVGCSDDDDNDGGGDTPDVEPLALGFESIRGSKTDAIVVPEGYTAQVLIPWGTPLNNSVGQWSTDRRMTPEYQAASVGMNHDGMYHFPLSEESASREFIMALNNEYIDQSALWAPQGGPTNQQGGDRPVDEVRTEINAYGITIVRLSKNSDNIWSSDTGSRYNRRITTGTPIELSGPVRGSDYVVTAYSNDGTRTRGTNNNCANGFTPWGTYLTCEENWPGIFIKNSDRYADDDRLGILRERSIWGWETAASQGSNGEFARFDATPAAASARGDYRNEPRTFGYVVEIDPYGNTTSVSTETAALKRTLLGRFRHEGCWPGKLTEGEPVVFYTGHDARNEYIYKFVSAANWDPADANRPGEDYDRLAIGSKYMDEGTLYVARFDADGSGEWLALTPDATTQDGRRLSDALGIGADDMAGVLINTCDAADMLGATPMDRPEWGTVDPASGDVYMTLTNNSDRTAEGMAATYTDDASSIEALGAGYDTAPVNAANPRPDNEAGQVIRWREPSAGATTFEWNIFVFGAAAGDTDNFSGLTELNQFASPDGLWYDDRGDGRGILWIETDNGYDGVLDYTNDQVLAVVPSTVSIGPGDQAVVNPDDQAQLRRFAVGPNGCEVTGIFATPDRTSLFINIQHPGNWPADPNQNVQSATEATSGTVRPRASTVVIQKLDGGAVGV
ncbi:PhoX family protein [Kushneria aurantia]|uniref:PhoX family phosphatase n=1 Tax=Kushneria aurantia TaxID=504092 RepID=A0ABV6G524_9GAMM|nr:alkaline phosphatase PhoX [Kushneria aurantia]